MILDFLGVRKDVILTTTIQKTGYAEMAQYKEGVRI